MSVYQYSLCEEHKINGNVMHGRTKAVNIHSHTDIQHISTCKNVTSVAFVHSYQGYHFSSTRSTFLTQPAASTSEQRKPTTANSNLSYPPPSPPLFGIPAMIPHSTVMSPVFAVLVFSLPIVQLTQAEDRQDMTTIWDGIILMLGEVETLQDV